MVAGVGTGAGAGVAAEQVGIPPGRSRLGSSARASTAPHAARPRGALRASPLHTLVLPCTGGGQGLPPAEAGMVEGSACVSPAEAPLSGGSSPLSALIAPPRRLPPWGFSPHRTRHLSPTISSERHSVRGGENSLVDEGLLGGGSTRLCRTCGPEGAPAVGGCVQGERVCVSVCA